MTTPDLSSTCAATPSPNRPPRCAPPCWPRRWATTSSRDDPSVNALAGADRRHAGFRGGAVRAHRHPEQPVRDSLALPARRRVHRRPAGALLPLGRRRRGGVRQRAAAAAGSPARRHAGAWPTSRPPSSPTMPHFARTRLLALENTLGGKLLPLAYVEQADAAGAAQRGWPRHLDGARLFNAAVAQAAQTRQRSARRSAPDRRAASTASLSASARGWARRWARRCAARANSSRVRTAFARWPAAACARPACWRRPRLTRWSITSIASRRITRWRVAWQKAWPAFPN